MLRVKTPADLAKYIGHTVQSPQSMTVTRAMLEAFLDISQDRQAIHTRQDAPVIPANLLLTLVPQLLQQTIIVEDFQDCMTVAYTSVRFHAPVHASDSLSMTATVISVQTRGHRTFIETQCKLYTHTKHAVTLCVKDLYNQRSCDA